MLAKYTLTKPIGWIRFESAWLPTFATEDESGRAGPHLTVLGPVDAAQTDTKDAYAWMEGVRAALGDPPGPGSAPIKDDADLLDLRLPSHVSERLRTLLRMGIAHAIRSQAATGKRALLVSLSMVPMESLQTTAQFGAVLILARQGALMAGLTDWDAAILFREARRELANLIDP